MGINLDLDVLPIFRRGGFDQPNLPGLHLALPPRRTARGRASDLLVLFLDLQGNAPLSSNQQTQLLSNISRVYYHHRGSVTASMRAAADELNQYFMDRNLRSANSGLQSIGLFNILVLRDSRLYLGQSGPIHAFVIAPRESQHLFSTQLAGRGLGTSRPPSVRFFQTDIPQGGLVLVSPAPPPTWSTATLKESYRLKLENIHRQLVSQAGPDLTAVVFKVRPGSGELHLLQPALHGAGIPKPTGAGEPPPARPVSSTAAVPAAAGRQTSRPIDSPAPVTPPPTVPESPKPAAPPQATPADPVHVTPAAPQSMAGAATPSPAAQPLRAEAGQAAPAKSRRRSFSPALRSALLAAGARTAAGWDSARRGLGSLAGRMTPSEEDFRIPSSVMLGIAIAVPIILITVAVMTYYLRGLTSQHQIYTNLAAGEAANAAEVSDPNELRAIWGRTLEVLDTAESFGLSPESQALRTQAQSSLDQLDGITRLPFQPALTRRLTDKVQISRLAASNEDLYMLNEEDGSVLRAWLTGRGYELDLSFSCGPGPYGSIFVGDLIDIAPLPKGNEFNATLLAMDNNGNLIYCIPGKSPIAAPLVPPDSNWGDPIAFTLDSGNLYVLDPLTNAVWIYRGANYNFREGPSLFFSQEVPPMQGVVDLAVNREDLYLLHADGHLTACTYSALPEAPTRCEDPALFTDSRIGQEQEVAQMPGTTFSQVVFTPPPDPSIYLLDPDPKAPYHFSLRLTYQRQYRSTEPLPEGPVTSMAVSPARSIFLSVGNEVYYANLP